MGIQDGGEFNSNMAGIKLKHIFRELIFELLKTGWDFTSIGGLEVCNQKRESAASVK